jgi:hypothetical protein
MNPRSVEIGLVFVAGCAVGGASARFVVPPASAQQAATLTKWEYMCFVPEASHMYDGTVAKGVKTSNASGSQGWEMVGGVAAAEGTAWCFKRPKL